jgi:hypothetical protein
MVSSTALDLPRHRKEIRDACLSQGITPIMMEHLGAVDDAAVAVSLRMVEGANLYIGIFANRYGHVPPGRAVSITELEYNRAVECGIPRLIFLMDPKHRVRAQDVEVGEGAARLAALKKRIGVERVVAFFTSPRDLRVKVADSLAGWLRSREAVPAGPAGAAPGLRLFFDHLIESHTRLFAGRDWEIRRILDFVEGGSGYVFLEGLSGYGKTSLLAELVRSHPHFAYHFISQGYKSSGTDFDPTQLEPLLANLCEQLEPGSPPAGDLRALRVRFQRLLLATPARGPTVLVLDGVDEVDRHPNYLLGLLPRRLPPGVVVILSARTQGDRCYLSEVGLDPADVGLSLRLSGLDEAAVGQLLERAGGRALAAAREPAFVAGLHAVSGGDPFYLRFLVEDVAGGTLTARNVHRTPSGLSGYLDRQLSHLNRSAYRPQHRDVLGLILAARGALSRADLIRLVPGLDGLNFDDVIRDIHRFLLVHQDQYTFCHSRFKDYFAGKVG